MVKRQRRNNWKQSLMGLGTSENGKTGRASRPPSNAHTYDIRPKRWNWNLGLMQTFAEVPTRNSEPGTWNYFQERLRYSR
jgi:hypothetical protein